MEHCSCNMYQCRSASDGAECLCVGGCLSDSHGTSVGHSFRRCLETSNLTLPEEKQAKLKANGAAAGPITLGVRPEQSVEFFLGGLPGRYRMADGPCRLQGALFTLDSSTGLCAGVERIEIQ